MKAQESNDLSFELSTRIQDKEIRVKIGLKKTWIITLTFAIIRLIVRLICDWS